MNRMILVGSPRLDGRSAHLAQQLFDACIDECPEDGVSLASVASLEVEPCVGCGSCGAQMNDAALAHLREVAAAEAKAAKTTAAKVQAQEEAAEEGALRRILYTCPKDDEMAEVAEALDAADELSVVCPLYFAGPPAQMKALIDRLQPYYYSDLRRGELRPCILHVIGEGKSPCGWQPLADILASALYCAGFALTCVRDWTGRIAEDGTILEDAEEYEYPLDEALARMYPEKREH